jgi:hypothetical protein
MPDPRTRLKVTEIGTGARLCPASAGWADPRRAGSEHRFCSTPHGPSTRTPRTRKRSRTRPGPAGPDDRVNDMVPEQGRGAGAARDLGGGFEEREPRTGRLIAVPAVLGREDFHGAGDADGPGSAGRAVPCAASRQHRSRGRP